MAPIIHQRLSNYSPLVYFSLLPAYFMNKVLLAHSDTHSFYILSIMAGLRSCNRDFHSRLNLVANVLFKFQLLSFQALYFSLPHVLRCFNSSFEISIRHILEPVNDLTCLEATLKLTDSPLRLICQ